MIVQYGFQATLTARPGRGGELAELLLTGMDEGGAAASEHCVVYLVSRSASAPDVVHITEGWTGKAEHERLFDGEAARALVSRITPLLAGEPVHADYVPVRGKAAFGPAAA